MVWSIAGSDCGAGAGLQADLKALQAFGVHGCTAVASVTAQSSVEVTRGARQRRSAGRTTGRTRARHAAAGHQDRLARELDNLRVVCRWVDALRARVAR